MGNKQYYNIILLDSIQNSHKQITDDIDIATLRDYMQVLAKKFNYPKNRKLWNKFFFKYSSLIDDLPAYMGGKSNTWRRLNLTGYFILCF